MNALVQDGRDSTASYVGPLLLALALHLVIFWLFAGGLEGLFPAPRPEPIVHKVIKASLVTIQPKPEPSIKPRPVNKKPAQPVKKAPSKPKPVPQKPKTESKPVEQKPVDVPVQADPRQALDELFAEEDELLQQDEEQSQMARYKAAISQAVEQAWSRPPSARNGMQAVLSIRLVPSGDVVSVNVLRGSGNAAFDRSAVIAVEKVGRFDFLQGMPSSLFDRHFRNIELLFNPKDLRL